MNPFDFLSIAVPAMLGGTLLAYSLRLPNGWSIRRFFDGYRSAHRRFLEKLVGNNFLRFPGACLIGSIRPWALSEAVFLLVFMAGCVADRSATGAFRALIAAIVLGACAAWLSLRDAAREALLSVRRDLPVACFLLSLLLESGMGTSSALQETASSIPPGPLALELGEIVRARFLGAHRGESIGRSRGRVPLEDYRLFLSHILQGERLGIGLSRSLRELSGKMLESQGHRAETIAQQAAVKLLFPLVCFIFPAVFLIILSPVILGLWGRFLR